MVSFPSSLQVLLVLLSAGLVLATPLAGGDVTGTPSSADQAAESSPTARQFAVAIPELKQTSYQSFDDKGGYSFGYAFPEQMHTETRSPDGEVTGSYFYRDPNGNSNQVQYRADKSGFRVTANNLPVYSAQPVQDTAEVAEAKQKHMQIWEAIASHNRAYGTAAGFRTDPPAEERGLDEVEEKGIVVEADDSATAEIAKKEELDVQQRSSAAARKEDELPAEARKEPEYVAPLDLEPLPAIQADVTASSPNLAPIDNDAVIDEEKEAVLITDNRPQDAQESSLIEIDAEPIKLLAQLYAKHIQAQNAEAPEEIARPEGFHPYHLEPPAGGFDLFSRSETADREAVEVTNPEYVDLRAFLLSNRFRDEQADPAEGPQIVIEATDRVVPSASYQQQIFEHDLLTSGDDEPDYYRAPMTQQLYNQYYNLPLDRPVFITRETLKDLPESLRLAILGVTAVDGQHTAQVAPPRNQQKKNNKHGGYYPTKNVFSPYSSYYSPYYYYNSHRWSNNPYYAGIYDIPVRAYAVPKPSYYYYDDPYYYY